MRMVSCAKAGAAASSAARQTHNCLAFISTLPVGIGILPRTDSKIRTRKRRKREMPTLGGERGALARQVFLVAAAIVDHGRRLALGTRLELDHARGERRDELAVVRDEDERAR